MSMGARRLLPGPGPVRGSLVGSAITRFAAVDSVAAAAITAEVSVGGATVVGEVGVAGVVDTGGAEPEGVS